MWVYIKNIALIFSLLKIVFLLVCFAIYKMVDSKYNMDIYKSIKINIGTVIKNPELLKFVPDHLKTKKLCKHAIKELPFVLRYVPDQYRLNKCVIELF